MKDSYTKKEAIEILQRALNKKDADLDSAADVISGDELKKMAAELHISNTQLVQAATEITSIKEQKRGDVFPQVIATRWINGRLTDQEVENVLSDIRHEFGGLNTWRGKPVKPYKVGKVWEYTIENASILLKEESDGYSLQVIKYQFFHGNNLEASVLAIPAAFLIGLLPVAAAFEWIHLYAAIFTAVIIYVFSFGAVKKYTKKKRSESVSRLLRITEFAEQKLKAAMGDQTIDMNLTDSESSAEPRKAKKRRLKS